VVSKSAHAGNHRALLPTTWRRSADEHASVLTPVRARLPLCTGLVPERLELSRVVAVTGRDTEEEGIVLLERLRVGEGGDAAVLWRSVHLGQDLIVERLFDLVEVAGAASFLDAAGLRLGEGLDVAPGGVLVGNVSAERLTFRPR